MKRFDFFALIFFIYLVGLSPYSVEASDSNKGLKFDFYLPEGDLSLYFSRFKSLTFFEGRILYDFVEGNFDAILRYKYYKKKFFLEFSLFDTIDFKRPERRSGAFERVRGVFFRSIYPINYYSRIVYLLEVDQYTSNKPDLLFTTDTTNTFVTLGYQIGIPDDPKSNEIIGDKRARAKYILGSYRKIGPGDFGFTLGINYAFKWTGGDYEYLKMEMETLKRFQFRRTFLITRFHFGSFPIKKKRDEYQVSFDKYVIPVPELFFLTGRDNLRGLEAAEPGTEQVLVTFEYVKPLFENSYRRFMGIGWESVYMVWYTGAGSVGFGFKEILDKDRLIYDLGLGCEAVFNFRKLSGVLTLLFAKALEQPSGIKIRASVKLLD